MDFGKISRRHLLQGGAALTLGAAAGVRPAFAADTTIGFIYVGSRDDYGYNQAHAQGAAALKKIPGLKVVEEEKVPETDAVEKTIESMINLDGATLLFPTSFGYYNPHMIKMATKFPKLRFRALRRPVERQGSKERRQLFWLYRRGPVHFGHRCRLHLQERQARLRCRQADPAGAA
ncbi:basic membrane lipoprotein Med (substrate-binding protein (PBP1-ABC) superfamily) [Bradyrhizobium sp. i1.3.1]